MADPRVRWHPTGKEVSATMPETVSAFGALGFLGTPSISSGANTPLSPSNGSARAVDAVVPTWRIFAFQWLSSLSALPLHHVCARIPHHEFAAHHPAVADGLAVERLNPSSRVRLRMGGAGKESAREGLSVGCITLPLRLRNNTRPTQRTETPWAACLACLTIYCSTPLHTLRRCNTLGWQGWPLTTSGVGCQLAQGAAAQESCQSVMSCSVPPSPVPSSRGSCLGKKQRSLPHARDATRMDDGRQVGLRA